MKNNRWKKLKKSLEEKILPLSSRPFFSPRNPAPSCFLNCAKATALAGAFTPIANVSEQSRILTRPRQKSISTTSFNIGRRPAWWTPTPRRKPSATLRTCGRALSSAGSLFKARVTKLETSERSAEEFRSRERSEAARASIFFLEKKKNAAGTRSRHRSQAMSPRQLRSVGARGVARCAGGEGVGVGGGTGERAGGTPSSGLLHLATAAAAARSSCGSSRRGRFRLRLAPSASQPSRPLRSPVLPCLLLLLLPLLSRASKPPSQRRTPSSSSPAPRNRRRRPVPSPLEALPLPVLLLLLLLLVVPGSSAPKKKKEKKKRSSKKKEDKGCQRGTTRACSKGTGRLVVPVIQKQRPRVLPHHPANSSTLGTVY